MVSKKRRDRKVDASIARRIAIERELARRGDRLALAAAVAVAELAELPLLDARRDPYVANIGLARRARRGS